MQNAFGERLSRFNFNPYEMLVVDPLHELDVGIWKEIFLHLIRTLYATQPDNVAVLDHRYVL